MKNYIQNFALIGVGVLVCNVALIVPALSWDVPTTAAPRPGNYVPNPNATPYIGPGPSSSSYMNIPGFVEPYSVEEGDIKRRQAHENMIAAMEKGDRQREKHYHDLYMAYGAWIEEKRRDSYGSRRW